MKTNHSFIPCMNLTVLEGPPESVPLLEGILMRSLEDSPPQPSTDELNMLERTYCRVQVIQGEYYREITFSGSALGRLLIDGIRPERGDFSECATLQPSAFKWPARLAAMDFHGISSCIDTTQDPPPDLNVIDAITMALERHNEFKISVANVEAPGTVVRRATLYPQEAGVDAPRNLVHRQKRITPLTLS